MPTTISQLSSRTAYTERFEKVATRDATAVMSAAAVAYTVAANKGVVFDATGITAAIMR